MQFTEGVKCCIFDQIFSKIHLKIQPKKCLLTNTSDRNFIITPSPCSCYQFCLSFSSESFLIFLISFYLRMHLLRRYKKMAMTCLVFCYPEVLQLPLHYLFKNHYYHLFISLMIKTGSTLFLHIALFTFNPYSFAWRSLSYI